MMKHRIHGAYVQAWVWVNTGDSSHDAYSDQQLRNDAKDQYHEPGSIEIDDNAEVSRNTEEWCKDCPA